MISSSLKAVCWETRARRDRSVGPPAAGDTPQSPSRVSQPPLLLLLLLLLQPPHGATLYSPARSLRVDSPHSSEFHLKSVTARLAREPRADQPFSHPGARVYNRTFCVFTRTHSEVFPQWAAVVPWGDRERCANQLGNAAAVLRAGLAKRLLIGPPVAVAPWRFSASAEL
ncbi:hypothetical protein AAFF_G00376480 [Aldrovandia affinis]|uniref:Uncharacterized protein n=1 Tax=Aldrovandia affinis TaxID=143900 RepID=A0AAD7SG46_9TELE|nr:hypothetical protein AAFF_G00376480 [Aldrovandia affinis]